MKLHEYVGKRLLLLVPVLIGISIITFSLSHFSGDPCAPYVTERMTEHQVEAICKARGFDRPIFVQYGLYLKNLVNGDLGYSQSANLEVVAAFKAFFPATLELTLVAMLIAVLVGIPVGAFSAVHKDKAGDHVTRLLSLAGVSLPVFVLALLMKYVLAFKQGWFPLDGRFDLTLLANHPSLTEGPTGFLVIDTLAAGDLVAFKNVVWHLILPAVTLSYATLAVLTRLMRSSMLEELNQDYVRTARAKGLPESDVITRHARRNALIPTTTVIGLVFGGLLGGAVITETIYSWPGLGRWSTSAFVQLDMAAVMGTVLFVGFVYVLANLVVDVVYAFLDPRIRLG